MSVFSFVPPAPPWDAAFFHVSSTFCCPLLPLGCGTFPRFVQGYCSFVLCRNQPAIAQTMFYTKQFLQRPTFTQTRFSTNHLLHPFTPTSSYTNALLHKPASKQFNCSTNQLLHKPPLQPTFTNQLLHKSAFTLFYPPKKFYTNIHTWSFRQTAFNANHLVHRPAFTTQFLREPLFRQTNQMAGGFPVCTQLERSPAQQPTKSLAPLPASRCQRAGRRQCEHPDA